MEPGKMTLGVATVHSAPLLNKVILSEKDSYVWPLAKGIMRGQAIEPLDKHVPVIVMNEKQLYELLALIDSIRVGKIREKEIAVDLYSEEINKIYSNR